MQKQVQIETDLFLELCDYFFSDNAPESYEAEQIRTQLLAKVDKMVNRDLFTKYKRTPTGAEREKARQEYLNHRGISRSFRSDTEYHEEEPPEE